MSIFLKAVQRINPSEPGEPKKWYPVQYTTKRVDESEVAMLIADETTLNPMEAAMAIRQLRKVVQRLLLDGKSVKLGDWGTFNVTLNTEGAERKEDLTARNVKRVNITFQPADEMKAAMQKADFAWLDKTAEGGTASGGGSTASSGGQTAVYTVRKGDTLWGIAGRYGVALTALIIANPQIKNPNLIYPGDQVRIP